MEILLGDITKVSADAIVNAANTRMQHGGGVAAAIVAAGGEIIQKESNDLGWVDIGKAAVTSAGKLKAKCVIHVPTIDYPDGKRASLDDIKKGTLAAFEIAKNSDCKSIAFPLLGARVVGLQEDKVALVIKGAADANPSVKATIVVNSDKDYNFLKKIIE